MQSLRVNILTFMYVAIYMVFWFHPLLYCLQEIAAASILAAVDYSVPVPLRWAVSHDYVHI